MFEYFYSPNPVPSTTAAAQPGATEYIVTCNCISLFQACPYYSPWPGRYLTVSLTMKSK